MTSEHAPGPEGPPAAPAGPPPQIRVAGAVVGLQGLLGVGFAVVVAVRALGADIGVGNAIGEAVYFALIGAALGWVGWGLTAGRRWARTPAIVAQLLLLPVVYSLIGPSRQLLLGIVTGVIVIGTFLLLISERSRMWSMGLDLPDARP
ncbi:hypothetical protein [Pseudonocardia sp. H11422]|uniref:hypothetical protein n=1 Tax=Pseudonocardia sp. H11422 TaxID=2835866 RepID=UPI001BDBB2A2|nr:hypothetical protein [Pseudonocardia sp. H11422]